MLHKFICGLFYSGLGINSMLIIRQILYNLYKRRINSREETGFHYLAIGFYTILLYIIGLTQESSGLQVTSIVDADNRTANHV